MPFTVSHAAAVLPLNRGRLELSALIAGSMSPDFLYYLPFIPNYHFTHSLPGILLFCLPASLLLLWLYHAYLKRPLLALLPKTLQRRLYKAVQVPAFSSPSRILWLICSVLLGALTHVFWDSFTHESGWMVAQLPFLAKPAFDIAGETIFVYKALQHGSTVVGGLIVLAWAIRRVQRETPAALPGRASAPQIWLPIMVVLSCISGLIQGWLWFDVGGVKGFIVQSVVGSMSAFFVLLFMFSASLHFRSDIAD